MSDEINGRIFDEFFKIHRSIKESLTFETKGLRLTSVQLDAMIFLKKNTELQMKDFSEFFSITMPTATSLIDNLIKVSLVTRRSDLKDRRIVKINITKLGEKIVSEAVKQRRVKFNKFLSNLLRDDKKELLRILGNI